MRGVGLLAVCFLPACAALECAGAVGARQKVLIERRAIFAHVATAALATAPGVAHANSDATMSSISTQTPMTEAAKEQFIQLPSGVKYKDVRAGTGATVRVGDTVAVQYTGRLLNLNGKRCSTLLAFIRFGGTLS